MSFTISLRKGFAWLLTGCVLMIFSALPVRAQQENVATVTPEELLAAPQKYWARAVVFKDVLERSRFGSTLRLENKLYVPFLTKKVGTCYATRELADKLDSLTPGQSFAFTGMVIYNRGRYFIVVSQATPVVDERELLRDLSAVTGRPAPEFDEAALKPMRDIIWEIQSAHLQYAREKEIPLCELYNPDSVHFSRAMEIVRSAIMRREIEKGTAASELLSQYLVFALARTCGVTQETSAAETQEPQQIEQALEAWQPAARVATRPEKEMPQASTDVLAEVQEMAGEEAPAPESLPPFETADASAEKTVQPPEISEEEAVANSESPAEPTIPEVKRVMAVAEPPPAEPAAPEAYISAPVIPTQELVETTNEDDLYGPVSRWSETKRAQIEERVVKRAERQSWWARWLTRRREVAAEQRKVIRKKRQTPPEKREQKPSNPPRELSTEQVKQPPTAPTPPDKSDSASEHQPDQPMPGQPKPMSSSDREEKTVFTQPPVEPPRNQPVTPPTSAKPESAPRYETVPQKSAGEPPSATEPPKQVVVPTPEEIHFREFLKRAEEERIRRERERERMERRMRRDLGSVYAH